MLKPGLKRASRAEAQGHPRKSSQPCKGVTIHQIIAEAQFLRSPLLSPVPNPFLPPSNRRRFNLLCNGVSVYGLPAIFREALRRDRQTFIGNGRENPLLGHDEPIALV